jgi:hypothetical protein
VELLVALSSMAAKQAQSGGVTQARSSAGCAHVFFLSRSCSACTYLVPSRPLQPIDEVAEYRVRRALVHTLFAVPTNLPLVSQAERARNWPSQSNVERKARRPREATSAEEERKD